MFEGNPDFLILVELQRLSRDDLPSTLRLLMSTRTYLECPREGGDMTSFWSRLKYALGKPLSLSKPCSDVTNDLEPPNISKVFEATLENYTTTFNLDEMEPMETMT
jgi:hypothetical protein